MMFSFVSVCRADTATTCKAAMVSLVKHLNSVHDQSLSYERLTFDNDELFSEWLRQTEREVPCLFYKQQWLKRVRYEYRSYRCNRSRVTRQKRNVIGSRRRKLKVQGHVYAGFTCPAHIRRYKMANGVNQVHYQSKHFCFSDRLKQLGYLRLPKQDRDWFAAKLTQKIPACIILKQARLNVNNQPTRQHVATIKDLTNIANALGIAKEGRRHAQDTISVDALVRSYNSPDSSPFILYKRQGELLIELGPQDVHVGTLNERDFVLAYMDEYQCEMLRLYGTGNMSVVCVDSTHGTNGYDFHLTTVMVLDSNRQGLPVAFLFSTKETEEVLELFFRAIRVRSGVIVTNSFMSDMAPQSYNSWERVMGPSKHRLYCAWHVDKAFRENTQKRIKDNDARINTYVLVRQLMTEHELATFEKAAPLLLSELRNNESTNEFARYFESNYLSCAQSWAYCYRRYCGINTNMALERYHREYKYKYQDGKRNKRLDNAVQALLDMVTDRKWDRLVSLAKGKYTKKLATLRDRHQRCLEVDLDQCQEIMANKEWVVQAKAPKDELVLHTVTRCDQSQRCQQSCNLRCSDCNACLHDYFCSCQDNCVRLNMCKHIHLVCMKFQPVLENQNDADDEMPALIIAATDSSSRQTEVDALMGDLSRSTSVSTDLNRNRDIAKDLTSGLMRLIETEEDNDVMLSIIETLRSMQPCIHAIKTSKTLPLMVPTEVHRPEPANKNIAHQRRFLSIKKKAAKQHLVSYYMKDGLQFKPELIFIIIFIRAICGRLLDALADPSADTPTTIFPAIRPRFNYLDSPVATGFISAWLLIEGGYYSPAIILSAIIL